MATATDVGNAVRNAVVSLNLTPAGNVAVRKEPGSPPGKTLPQIVVSVGEEGDVEHLWKTKVLVKYPAAVAIVTTGGNHLADDVLLRTWREAVRKKVLDVTTYAGVAGFNDVTASGKAPFDPAGLDRAVNYSTLVFTVEVIEDRN